MTIGQILHDDRPLAQPLAIGQFERRYGPLGIDVQIVSAVRQPLVHHVDPFIVERDANLSRDDIDRQRASPHFMV